MTQQSILKLAKQGDIQAINSLMNYLLQDKGLTATAAFKDTCLVVLLKSAQVPEQQSSVEFIQKLMMKLEVPSIQSVQVYGKQIGQDSAAWNEFLDLTHSVEKKVEEPKNRRPFTPLHLTKGLISIVCAFCLTGAGYLVYSKLKEPVPSQALSPVPSGSATLTPTPILSASPSPATSAPATLTPTPVTSETPSPQPDSFREAVNKAMSAAKLTQSAKSKQQWNLVANQWQQAIALMKAVPTSSPNYAVAQKKVAEYQTNLDYASLAANSAK